MELKEFIKILKSYFEKADGEWVDVYVTPSKRVDITIVSDKFINRTESQKFISDAFEKLDKKYSEGFSTYDTLEDADLLAIEKPNRNMEKEVSWEKAALNYLNDSGQEKCEKTQHSSKIISFYSYKGGVGRTVAIIHTAYLLAKKGRNVLLIDLDLEAPSLYDIFEDKLDIENGLVDYLYDCVMGDGNNRIQVSQIYSRITFDETLKGNVYVIPAGILSPEYLFRLKQLHPNLISQHEYLDRLISELEDILNLDTILIDSRTGLNEWGAFSLLDIADEVMFFSYPNQENIRGLRMIIDLMKTAGCKNLTMIFSRIDPNGMEHAKELFNQLDLKQKFIDIIYKERLAIDPKYPCLDAITEFKPLADYIIEDEYEVINSYYLDTYPEKRQLVLKSLLDYETIYLRTEPEAKIRETNVWFIEGDKRVLTDRILEYYNDIVSAYPIIINNNILGLNEELIIEYSIEKLKVFAKENSINDWSKFWFACYMYLINEENDLQGIKALRGKDITDYINFIEPLEKEEITRLLQKATLTDKIISKRVDSDVEHFQKITIVLADVEIFGKDSGWLKGLYNSISIIKKSGISNVDIKVMVSKDLYQLNREEFNSFKGNVLNLEWKQKDIINVIAYYLQEGFEDILDDYIYAINRANNFKDFAKHLEMYQARLLEEDDFEEEAMEYGDNLFSLFWGFRVVRGKYSQLMKDWFFEQLQKSGDINPVRVFEIIKKAVEIELLSSKSNQFSLISIESLKKAFEENE
ncbi:MAG: AAA family ATPase [Halanaerobiales bacterium]|nr:AAA family ATPase [Halanaerobiales bacterium]